jgi:arginine decarboxylase
VTPYPPGFPVLVPGQMFSREILKFMRELDTPEIHGYKPEFGYRVYTEKAIEMCRPVQAVVTQAVQLAPIIEVQPKAPQPAKAKKSNGNRPPEPADAL